MVLVSVSTPNAGIGSSIGLKCGISKSLMSTPLFATMDSGNYDSLFQILKIFMNGVL